MTIIAYLLSFTLLVTSVIKVTDLFIHADKVLDSKRLEFIQQTKKTHQDGSITLMGALLTVMLSALLMFFALKFKVELAEARYRKDSYLCFQDLNLQTENYISDITKLNWALTSAYAATFTGVATVMAKATFEGLQLARDARHLLYIKDLALSSYCKSKTAALLYIKNQPYKTHNYIKLATSFDGTTFIRENKWTVAYYKSPKGIRIKNSFCLQADMEIENSYVPNFKIKTKEISMAGFSKLKCLSGFQ
jgi:hypothetical protein